MPYQHLFFTSNLYGRPYHITRHQEKKDLTTDCEVLLVSGIANPQPLKDMLDDNSKAYYMLHYPDHHIFTIDDWKDIRKRFEKIEAKNKIILTTEKDAVRLAKFEKVINDFPLYVIPIEHYFLFNQDKKFMELVTDYIQNFKISETK